MKKQYLYRIVAFLALLIVLDRVLYCVLAAGFRQVQVGQTGGLVNRARQVRADVVVLGSSRAWHHYDSSILHDALKASVYNAGSDGQGMPYIRGVADLLLHDYTPKLFIINADPATIVYSDENYDRVTYLAPFIDESPAIRQVIYRRGPFEPIKYLSWSFRYNSKPLAILRNLKSTDDTIMGFNPLDETFRPAPAASPATQAGPSASKHALEEDSYLAGLLRQTIEASRAAGVRVVLASSPRWAPNYRVPPEQAPLYERLRKLADEEGVRYVVVTQENTSAFHDPALFADSTHLNRQGAKMFTEILAQRLVADGYASLGSVATEDPSSLATVQSR